MRQSGSWLLTLVAVIVMLGMVSAAFAATVVVKPSNMNGWIADAYKGKDVNATTPTYSFSDTTAPPFLDAFYMSVGASNTRDSTLPAPWGSNEEACNEIWCGTNQFNGTKISDITRLEYSTFTEFSGNLWESHVSNGIKLLLSIKTDGVPDNYPPEERTADGPRNWLVLWYSPWDPGNGPGLGTWDRTAYDCWETWNLLDGVFFVYNEPNDNNWQTWSEIVANYPNSTLEYPYTYAENMAASSVPIFDPWKAPYPAEARYNAANLTGTSLSFQAGCRRPWDDSWFGVWWKEHYNLRGFVDMLTVGVNNVDTTFDFQADTPSSPFYATSNAGAVSPVMDVAENNFHFVIYGMVQWNELGYSPEFVIDDGSGVMYKVKAPNNTVGAGDYIRAEGMLRNGYLQIDDVNADPLVPVVHPSLFTDADHVTVLVGAPAM